jgi:SAM-dependent methyltransferase
MCYEYEGKPELFISEIGLENYNKYISALVSGTFRTLGVSTKARIMDFGAGNGNLTDLIYESGYENLCCLEIDEDLIRVLSKKGYETFSVLGSINENFSAVYSSNVLEHIENDREALLGICRIIKNGGVLVLYLPARNVLFSEFDVKVGHFRRYDKKSLKSLFEGSGMKIREIRYIDSIGFFVAGLYKLLLWMGIKKINVASSFKLFDIFILPISKIFDRSVLSRFLGKNIIVVAQKLDT